MAHMDTHLSVLLQCFCGGSVHDVKLLCQAFLWGRTIKHCAIQLCLHVHGIRLKMAIKSEVKNVHFLKCLEEEMISKVAGCCKKRHLTDKEACWPESE